MLDLTPLTVVLTVVAGVVTGALSAAFGVGGAVVSTPAIRLLGVSAAVAIGTTLPSILPSAATGAYHYTRQSLILWPVVAVAGPAGIVGSVIGSLLSRKVPGDGHPLMLLTAGLLGFTAFRMSRTPPPVPPEPETDLPAASHHLTKDLTQQLTPHVPPANGLPSRPLLAAIGGAAGLLSGLLGVGGGVVMVPGFTELGRIPLKPAIATSLACVGLLAIPGTLTHWSLGGIDWPVAGLLSLGVIPGARVGAVAALRAGDVRLRLAVAWFLGIVAVVYATGEFGALA